MKVNKKALELIEKGLSSKTVSKLNEAQISILHSKLLAEAVTQTTTTSYNVPPADAEKGFTLPEVPGKKMTIQKTPQGGIKATPTEEVKEDEEDSMDFDKGERTQDPHQVGPSSDDGFDNYDDGTGEFNEAKKESEKNPWAICHAQLGPRKNAKFESCVKQVKKSLKEGKNPVTLFLEDKIMKLVESHIPPRITKKDLVSYLVEAEPKVAPKPGVKEPKPGTKNPPKIKPSHPGKNPNPNVNPAPKAGKEEEAKAKVIDTIVKILKNG